MTLSKDGTSALMIDCPSTELSAAASCAYPSGTIVYGAFKAMGDLLNASPVLASQLDSGHKIKLLLFPDAVLGEFAQLIDFGPNRSNLEVLHLPVSGGVKAFRDYFAKVSRIDPALVWVSPHAPRTASSWRIPLLLWFTKTLFWRKARMAGATSERFSWLFDARVPVSRDLPYMEREHLAFSMLSDSGVPLRRVGFVPRIQQWRNTAPLYDLLIHPGANAPSRMWPSKRYEELFQLIPRHVRSAVVGVPKDIEMMRGALPANRGIEFLTGSLEQAITAIARSRVVFTMDSGAVHFARVLNVPTVTLFGKCDPATVISPEASVLPIYEQKFSCQPCGQRACVQPEPYCINSISAPTAAEALLRLLGQPSQF